MNIYSIEVPEGHIIELTARLRDSNFPNITWHRTKTGFMLMSGAPGHFVMEMLKRIEQPELFVEVKHDDIT